ncbi:hypothetical protein CEXT_174491 [Caerostris extrusa]|uniref:Uncharacterized protein n=1 Tax=Caerostris extrusa TaxID=172846 RepID=A0AAV4RDH9_CAEEX|nr:hypothetical protein CEXT_174491 [Caerostris extrusa]
MRHLSSVWKCSTVRHKGEAVSKWRLENSPLAEGGRWEANLHESEAGSCSIASSQLQPIERFNTCPNLSLSPTNDLPFNCFQAE